MSGFVSVITMALLLGAGSFSVSLLPLSFNFSRAHINQLSNFGTGLLLGAALGVIIPEYDSSLIRQELWLSRGFRAEVLKLC
jgi:zinc transporter 9